MFSRSTVQSRRLLHVQLQQLYLQSTTRRAASSTSSSTSQTPPTSNHGSIHTNFYRSHGRALFKSLTLAFFSYQVFYWSWITLETETMKDEKNREIAGLESEVKLLGSGVGTHRVINKEAEEHGDGKLG